MERLLSILSLFLVAAIGVLAQSDAGGAMPGIRIVPHTLEVRDDSVRIQLEIKATGIYIPGEEALTLIPELHFKGKQVVLPAVVFSGTQRARFDRRAEAVNPSLAQAKPYQVWISEKNKRDYALPYYVSIPYAAWMEHAALVLKQVRRDCCTEQLLANDTLTNDIGLTSPCSLLSASVPAKEKEQPVLQIQSKAPDRKRFPVIPSTPQQRTESTPDYAEGEHRVRLDAYLDYPLSGSRVDPGYGHNWQELQNVSELLTPLLGNPHVVFKEIRITGYSSPEGAYFDNEALSKSRALGFRSYLLNAYGLDNYPLRTAWVAEDWEGLRRLVQEKPYARRVVSVIDQYGIFEGRERYLIELEGGAPYKDMRRELFPRLRRIEISIIYNVYKEAEEVHEDEY